MRRRCKQRGIRFIAVSAICAGLAFSLAAQPAKAAQVAAEAGPRRHRTGGVNLSDEEVQHRALAQNARARAYLKEEQKNLRGKPMAHAPAPNCAKQKRYDLRAQSFASPIQNQGSCDSCWIFAAVSSVESSWKMTNGQDIGASEQHLINCMANVSCNVGSFSAFAFTFMEFAAIPTRKDVPYLARVASCSKEVERRYSVGTWGFIGDVVFPGVDDIKQAICDHGSIAAAMHDTKMFDGFGHPDGTNPNGADDNFVYRENYDPGISTSHVVSIIGWDDAKGAWIIKNSWGTDWGIKAGDPSPKPTRGYAYMAYKSNGVGRWAVWAHARRACPGGGEYDAGLCYPACKAGYHGVGPMCWENCPSGMVDDGITCRTPLHTFAKKTHTRGVGKPMGCGPGEEESGLLCYPHCKAGYSGVGPVCWENCKPGYSDTGVGCFKGMQLKSADTSQCPWYNVCGLGSNCSKCPAGWHDDGCTCRIGPDNYFKKTEGRGVGKVVHACAAGLENSGGLCYPKCPAGYQGVGPVCWQQCPAGYNDEGVFCAQGGGIKLSKSYGRGVGKIP